MLFFFLLPLFLPPTLVFLFDNVAYTTGKRKKKSNEILFTAKDQKNLLDLFGPGIALKRMKRRVNS